MLPGLLRGVPAEHGHAVLDVAFAAGGQELHLDPARVGARGQAQAAWSGRSFAFAVLDEQQERLLGGVPQPEPGLRPEALAVREALQELLDLRQRPDLERGLHAHASRPGELHERRQRERGQPARRHPVVEHLLQERGQPFRRYRSTLKPGPDPEGHAHDGRLAIVHAVLHDDSGAEHEEHGDDHHGVGADHRIRNDEQQRRHLREKGQRTEDDPDAHAHTARRDPRDLDDGDAARIRRVGHRGEESGEEVAQAVGGHGPLDRPIVRGPWFPPGDALDGDRVPDGLDRAHESDEGVGRQNRPEGGAEVEAQARPAGRGHADPGGLCKGGGIDQTEERRGRTSGRDADQRAPQPHRPGELEHDGQGHDERGEHGDRCCQRRGAGRHVVLKIEQEGHHVDRDQHDHRPGDRGRDDPAQNRQPPREEELEER